jgi:hypothetical protein
MSRTLTLTATAAPAPAPAKEEASKPPLIDARLIDALFARGVRAVPSARAGEFLYTRDASSSPIVATAVRFSQDGGHKVDKAFTRGDWSLSDNFDAAAAAEGGFVAVENLTFGPAKTFLERAEGPAFIADGTRWPRARVLASLPCFAKGVDRFASLEAVPAQYYAQYYMLQNTCLAMSAPNTSAEKTRAVVVSFSSAMALSLKRRALLSLFYNDQLKLFFCFFFSCPPHTTHHASETRPARL